MPMTLYHNFVVRRNIRLRADPYLEISTNAINNFAGAVGCVPRTHHLIGVIGDHAL